MWWRSPINSILSEVRHQFWVLFASIVNTIRLTAADALRSKLLRLVYDACWVCGLADNRGIVIHHTVENVQNKDRSHACDFSIAVSFALFIPRLHSWLLLALWSIRNELPLQKALLATRKCLHLEAIEQIKPAVLLVIRERPQLRSVALSRYPAKRNILKRLNPCLVLKSLCHLHWRPARLTISVS